MIQFKLDKKLFIVGIIAFLSCANLTSQAQNLRFFKNPPSDNRPKVLWQWPGGLITKDGITKDLIAMAKQGVGGVQIMQMPDQEPHPYVWAYRDYPGKVKILSEEWFNLVNYAIGEADKLGLTVEMFLCPGWNYAGSPAVTAEESLKQLSVSRTIVKGDSLNNIILPKAPIGLVNWMTPSWDKNYNRVHEFEKHYYKDIAVIATPHLANDKAIDPATIVDLSQQMKSDGKLSWKTPHGEWEIWRIALVTANVLNHPAPLETLGQEADRMDTTAVKVVYDAMIGRINREARAKGYHAFIGFETDSYESGYQDFSLDFAKEFKKRNGYDCIPWLPVWKDRNLVIGDPLLSQRFIRDMKKTVSDLWQERFFQSLHNIAQKNKLDWKLQPYFTVSLDWRSISQLAKSGSEFWVNPKKDLIVDGTGTETAVLYGQKKVWAEAFTAEPYNSAWKNTPEILKPVVDFAYTKGINDLYMHGFPLNSFSDKYQPGFSMGYWGTNLGRFVTWWSYSKAWHTYLARSNYMLQQGLPVTDALVYPDDMEVFPHVIESPYKLITLTDDVLLKKLFVKNKKLMLPDGQIFQALILKDNHPVSPEALQKIKSLVAAGATLIGNPPPSYSSSLKNYPQCDNQVKKLIDEIWNTSQVNGRVIASANPNDALAKIIGEPDLVGGNLIFAHRKLENGELFFVSNQKDKSLSTNVSFKVTGLKPEWWDAVTGETRLITNYKEANGRTFIPLALSAQGSGFVVFKKMDNSLTSKYKITKTYNTQKLEGSWDVSFDKQWGGPEHTKFNELTDWSSNKNAGIKYYSGTAFYEKVFNAKNTRASIIDLGVVHNIAEIQLNGKSLGTVWCAPWRVAIPPKLLKAKSNILRIKIANTWVNRLIGDEQEPEDCELITANTTGNRTGGYKIGVIGKALKDLPDWLINDKPRPSVNRKTFTSWRYYDKNAPLEPSGLIGPITLKIVR